MAGLLRTAFVPAKPLDLLLQIQADNAAKSRVSTGSVDCKGICEPVELQGNLSGELRWTG